MCVIFNYKNYLQLVCINNKLTEYFNKVSVSTKVLIHVSEVSVDMIAIPATKYLQLCYGTDI